MTSCTYSTRSPHSHYDIILIVTSFATELATPTVSDVCTYVTYRHLTVFNIQRFQNMVSVMLVFARYVVTTGNECLTRANIIRHQHSCTYKMHSKDKYRVHLDHGNKQQL